MKNFIYLVVTLFVVTACTIDKTDYESETNTIVPNEQEFKEVVSFVKDQYTISLEALNGHLYKGYNEIQLRIIYTDTKQPLEDVGVTFLPVLTTATGLKESCPNTYQLVYHQQNKYYQGYTVFTTESTTGEWNIAIRFVVDNQAINMNQTVVVEEQQNKNLNMTSFVGLDQEQYIIALIAPIKPKVAENALVAGIYKRNMNHEEDALQDSYTIAANYTLLLDPRMPEPSMGNHSSPNNKDLMQKEDQFYHGIVNYTMTGNWTLNFILLNQQGRIIKGTKVPTDFTPGVEGVKSELHIDTLF